jgi:SPP1 gp7 family putative phage head morphogenesis protein
MPLPLAKIEELITGVYEGVITITELPEWLYFYTVENLDSSFFAGFGQIAKGDLLAIDKAVNFRQNIGRFSGAKTFQEIKSLTDSVFTADGKKTPFAQFKEKALKIDANYNVNWLKTEQNTVISQSQNARKWMKYDEQKSLFPYLKYVTVGDERVRVSHKSLNGLVARVNDPIWNRIMPQNEWACRCTVIQLHEAEVTSKAEKEAKTQKLFEEFKKNPEFDYNPGKVDYIFDEKQGYFKVPRNFKDDLKKNFGFPNIDDITGKSI